MKINIKGTLSFINKNEFDDTTLQAQKEFKKLLSRSGKGNDFLGWIDLVEDLSETELTDIQNTANLLRKKSEAVLVIGIGGSYLGARAVIEALKHYFPIEDETEILYAGHNISGDYLHELKEYLSGKNFSIVVISKSGTTTEPAIAFRIMKNLLEKKYGRLEASKRIIAITDKEKGALKQLAIQESYKSYIIPDDVGGRYSVFTPVGLLPIAIAGFDIKALVNGAISAKTQCSSKVPIEENPAIIYSSIRNLLYKKGYTNEILVNYNPKLMYVAEWWKQLFGESEGKEGKGIFPASVNFTTDLHSMGQYIQEGKRNLFETVLSVNNEEYSITVPNDSKNLDKLNYLAGREISDINKQAETGTRIAHIEGGVPNIILEIDKLDEKNIGKLLYFYEISCGISGYLLDINPFDQPGVEAYKKNMFALLDKPGFEKLREEILRKM